MSQANQILNYLKNHPRGITRIQAFDKFGITELSARIIDLEHKGHKIGREMMKKDGKRFARYFYAG